MWEALIGGAVGALVTWVVTHVRAKFKALQHRITDLDQQRLQLGRFKRAVVDMAAGNDPMCAYYDEAARAWDLVHQAAKRINDAD